LDQFCPSLTCRAEEEDIWFSQVIIDVIRHRTLGLGYRLEDVIVFFDQVRFYVIEEESECHTTKIVYLE